MQQKVNVRFKIGTQLFPYMAKEPLNKGDYVIVESDIGQSYGIVDSLGENIEDEKNDLKKIIRKATDQDKKKHEQNLEKEKQAILETKNLVEKLKLDMNVVNAEYSFDGSKVIIDFIAEERVDFRELVKELVSKLRTRIELKQIGIRDQASMVGGIGICGRVCCCASHLRDFEKVSIKMAKTQGLALNPSKISGACGRLMCCLEYENDYYSEVNAKMPKLNSEVKTPDGKGTVLYENVLKQTVTVKLDKDDSVTIKNYNLKDITFIQNNKGSQQNKSIKQDTKTNNNEIKQENSKEKNNSNKKQNKKTNPKHKEKQNNKDNKD